MRKTISLITLCLMIISSAVSATTVNTDYSGAGDFSIQTTIISPVTPTITDSATIHTGCAGGCCCCPDCSGSYDGNQIVTNNPFSASGHKANVVNGCVVIDQKYNDNVGNQNIQTDYYTYFNGTGYAESYVYAVPGQGMSYQLANGTGSSFVGFTQIVFLNNNFDYGTSYGGGVFLCEPGYAGLFNNYHLSGEKIFYNSQLGMYCQPTDDSSLYAFLFAKSTGSFNLSSDAKIGSVEHIENAGAEGESEYGTVINSNNDNIDFDFDMELG